MLFEGAVRVGSVSPGPEANARGAVPALIECIVPLPSLLSLRSKGALEGLYTREHLSAREIERLIGASHAGVLGALDRFGIPRNGTSANELATYSSVSTT